MSVKKPTAARRTEIIQFSISPIHDEAFRWFVDQLANEMPGKRVNHSSTFEWMIEKVCKGNPKLAEYLKLRNEMNKLTEDK